ALPALNYFGRTNTPVVTVDGIGRSAASVRAMAAALVPYAAVGNSYPGLRRVLSEADADAFAYAVNLLESAAPYLGGAFDLNGFDMIEASFSLVTTPAAALTPMQRAPHYDSVDDNLYAVLHYLAPCEGTAFYRHRTSGIEMLSPENMDGYIAAARSGVPPSGYIVGDNAHYDCIGRVEGVEGRLVAYPARLLHSGIIPPDFVPSSDPAMGRLTTNIFIRGR
ncbi:MAG: DUF6445 family protein, partial [Sphingopyxis sp.]